MRTTPDLVRAAIGVPCTVNEQNVDVSPFISTANKLVNYIVGKDTAGVLIGSGLDLELETYLACFYLALKYQKFKQKSTGDASATFQTGQPIKGGFFTQNDWGVAAIGMDVSGTLLQLNNGVTKISFGWLGTPNNAMIPWWQRNPLTNC